MSAPDVRDEDLLSLIRRRARDYGDRTFMSFGDGSSMSFLELERRVDGCRAHLSGMGVRPGDRVGLMLQNSLFYPVVWLGTLSAGAIAVPINNRLGEVDARYVMDHSGATALVVDDHTQDVAKSAAPDAVRAVFVAQAGAPMEGVGTDEAVPPPRLAGGTVANIQYTSGTTGFPKGCVLTHRYWQRMGATAVAGMGITEGDVLLTSQPHSYVDPQWNVIAALRAGAHLVLLDAFHPSTFMSSVVKWRVTLFYCLGVMPTLLLKQAEAGHDHDHRLRSVYCSAIPPDSHAEIEQRWSVPWYEAFGMTETGVNTFVPSEEHDRVVGTGCIGRPVEHNEAVVVDDEDRELPPGEEGELLIRGVGFMNSYYRDPRATASFFRNGWAHTGDLAVRDEEGLLYYRGRIKQMIRRGGENISPVEIEGALGAHPSIIECAVSPVPDADLGEEIKSYVVLRPDADVTASDLAGYLRSRIASFKVPRYWEFRSSLPHTPSERVAKAELERGRSDWRHDTTDLRRV